VAGLLEGVRVLDLTTILAGPFAAYQLSLLGADVIKIELPVTGDLARELSSESATHIPMMGASFVAQNCGKRSITLNLKTEEGAKVFERLLRAADVLLENMRPGVLARLGFPWERLHELNPELIYCAVSGFGQTGPFASRPAYDQIIQGLAGMADVTGSPDGGPLRAGFPIADTLGGFAASMAICAALARRVVDRTGCFLDVSMLETALTAMGWAVSDHLIAGRDVTRNGNSNATSAPSGTFQTGDGLLNIAANTQTQFETLCRLLDCVELVDDPRFVTRTDRKLHRAELTEELELRLAGNGAAEWESMFAAASIPAGRVLTVDQALHQDQVRVRGLLHEVEIPVGDVRGPGVGGPGHQAAVVLGSGVHVDARALGPSSPPPLLGEHTDSILDSLGYSAEEITELHTHGAV